MDEPAGHSPELREEPSPEQPLTELISRMTGDVTTLFRKEIELAKIEVKEDLRHAGKAGAMFGGAGFAGYMVVMFVSLAIVFLLGLAVPLWSAFLIVAALYGIAGYVLYQQGRARMKEFTPGPEQTVETIKEDIQWVKTRAK